MSEIIQIEVDKNAIFEIIRNEVDKNAISEIVKKIKKLDFDVYSLNEKLNYFHDKKNRLNVTHFCGMKIFKEIEEMSYDWRIYYELHVQVYPYRWFIAEAYENVKVLDTFVSCVKSEGVICNIQFGIETFEEAKKICRQWLADIIYKRYEEDDINE